MLVVIGGHSRKIGKTSAMAALIEALRDLHWTAVKISPHPHKSDPQSCTDTARFLAAGAVRSCLLHAPADLSRILESDENVILESNSILELVKPDLYLVVLDFSVPDFKESSRRYLDRADAFIVIDRGIDKPPWEGMPALWYESKPRFLVKPPGYVSPELAEFVRGHTGNATRKDIPPGGSG